MSSASPPPPTSPDDSGGGETRLLKRPWWTWAVPYPGPTPRLPARQWRLLGLLVIAELFEHFDIGLLSLALLQIQQGLGIAENELGSLLGIVRLGALPAVAVGVLSDRFGRRRLLLVTVIGSALFTLLSGLAQSEAQYKLFQFFARTFLYAEPLLASVVLVEELQARDRGFGIGMLGALGALGHALGAILFSVIEWLPNGWRDLYVIGAAPLFLVAWLRRSLPETGRFERHSAAAADKPWHHSLVALLRQYPGRLAAITAATAAFQFVETTAVMFTPKILQEVHGYDPHHVSGLYLLGGLLVLMGNLYAGGLSDRYGRRPVMTVLIFVLGTGYWVLYNGAGFVVQMAWVCVNFSAMGLGVLFKALGAELFPTSHRSTATMVRAGIGISVGSLGLFLESALYDWLGSHVAAISMLLPFLLLTPLLLWLTVPESARRELEEISPSRDAAGDDEARL